MATGTNQWAHTMQAPANQQNNRNRYLDQAGQRISQRPQQPGLWGTAQNRIQQTLSPGYSAYSPEESDARYRAMQRRINRSYDQRGQRLGESLNQRGLYRTGLYDQAQEQYVEDPRQQALTGAATDVYIGGQDATRQQIGQALQYALSLGGQQAGLEQSYLAQLLGLGQYMDQADFRDQQWQHQLDMERQRLEQERQQAFWDNALRVGTIASKFFLPTPTP